MPLQVDCATFAARDAEGSIINHHREMIELIRERCETHAINANLVIGSKSGIKNNISVIFQTPEEVMWSIDLCQFRASRTLINGLMGMN